jgi:hypothetical protein
MFESRYGVPPEVAQPPRARKRRQRIPCLRFGDLFFFSVPAVVSMTVLSPSFCTLQKVILRLEVRKSDSCSWKFDFARNQVYATSMDVLGFMFQRTPDVSDRFRDWSEDWSVSR